MFKFLSIPLYVKIYSNQYVINALDEFNRELVSEVETLFTSERHLIGNSMEAEKSLLSLIKKITVRGMIRKSPLVLIQPMEKIEGGLSEVELRIFQELARSSGAVKVVIHTDRELSKDQVLTRLKA